MAKVKFQGLFRLDPRSSARYIAIPMKTILIIFALITSAMCDEFRTWTQLGSGKTIQAKIIDKEPTKARLSMKDGKSHWLEIANFIDADREYITTWKKKPLGFDPLSVSVIGKPQVGVKLISVTAKTWDKPAKLCVFYEKGSSFKKCDVEIEPFGSHSWQGDVSNGYVVILFDLDGNIISQQTATSKD